MEAARIRGVEVLQVEVTHSGLAICICFLSGAFVTSEFMHEVNSPGLTAQQKGGREPVISASLCKAHFLSGQSGEKSGPGIGPWTSTQ